MNARWPLVGLLTVTLGAASAGNVRAADEKEGKEEKVAFKELPKAVRKTLEREANGEKIKTVDKEEQDGKTVYEADVKIDGTNYEILVDEHGKLLSKKIDEEDEATENGKGKKQKEKEDDEKNEKK